MTLWASSSRLPSAAKGISIVVSFLRDNRVGYDNLRMQNSAEDGGKCMQGADVVETEEEATPLGQ